MPIFSELFSRHDFQTESESDNLESALEELVQEGRIRKIPALTRRGKIKLPELWFLDPESNEIFRFVPADFPSRGAWEKVDISDYEFEEESRS